MKIKKNTIKFLLINITLALLLFVIQYNTAFSVKIAHANPMLPLCLCIVYSMFAEELGAVIFSLAIGVITDGAAISFSGFNSISFILISISVAVTVRHLFNNNIRSAVVLALIVTAMYYISRSFICSHGTSLEQSIEYLMYYAFPSVIYSAAVIIPLYYFEKFIFGKYYAR